METEEIRSNLEENERLMMQSVQETLRNYNHRIRFYIADVVSSLCDIDKERMFSDTKDHDVAHARALYWYAYRYMTGETYEQIGKTTKDLYGKEFTKIGVATGVNRMCRFINEQPIWNKRWAILKHIIKIQNSMVIEPNIPITITVPKNVELNIKRE
jgi:hypothetical protein